MFLFEFGLQSSVFNSFMLCSLKQGYSLWECFRRRKHVHWDGTREKFFFSSLRILAPARNCTKDSRPGEDLSVEARPGLDFSRPSPNLSADSRPGEVHKPIFSPRRESRNQFLKSDSNLIFNIPTPIQLLQNTISPSPILTQPESLQFHF